MALSFPCGAASEWRKIPHKTLLHQAIFIIHPISPSLCDTLTELFALNLSCNKPELHSQALFMSIGTWTSKCVAKFVVSSILVVSPN